MNRPKWWKYKNAGKYLYNQYRYIKKVYKISTSEIIEKMGYTNRSSLFNLFYGHVYVSVDNVELYKKIFMLNKKEAEYIRLLTLFQKAASDFEKSIWEEELEKHLDKFKE